MLVFKLEVVLRHNVLLSQVATVFRFGGNGLLRQGCTDAAHTAWGNSDAILNRGVWMDRHFQVFRQQLRFPRDELVKETHEVR